MACRLRVGLTGGIGSGKTTASDYFAQRGAAVIDTDRIARELVEPGQPALQEIVALFGAAVLDAGGRLKRETLREQVFADPAQRRRLEAVLHPRIRARADELAAAARAPYCIFVIPLLVETAYPYDLDRVLVIDAPEAQQYRRIRARNGLDDDAIAAILASQASREQRLQAADDVVVNDGDLDHLYRQLDRLDKVYRGLAGGR